MKEEEIPATSWGDSERKEVLPFQLSSWWCLHDLSALALHWLSCWSEFRRLKQDQIISWCLINKEKRAQCCLLHTQWHWLWNGLIPTQKTMRMFTVLWVHEFYSLANSTHCLPPSVLNRIMFCWHFDKDHNWKSDVRDCVSKLNHSAIRSIIDIFKIRCCFDILFQT